MLGTLIQKELKSILLSPKFVATFGVCAVLILLSIYVGIQEYHAAVEQNDAAIRLAEQQMLEQSSWFGLNNRAFRKPDPMQIFVSGINNDIGRFSNISNRGDVKLENSIYMDDPIFAVFRFIDFAFIVQIVLSLFAILFTYDAINGERESGTLQLTFSNAVPRTHYILAKFIGSWLGLIVPLLIPIMLGILLVFLFHVSLDSVHWAKLATLLGVSILFFTFFITFGLFISVVTRHSAISFLVSLVIWVTLVLIVPRAGVMLSGQIISVPSVAEINSQIDGFNKNRWNLYTEDANERWNNRQAEMEGMTHEESDTYRDEKMSEWLEEDDIGRRKVQEDIAEYSRKLNEDLRNRRAEQERLAFKLSRFSPASAYQLAAMNLAETDIILKSRYEDVMRTYRSDFVKFVEEKQSEAQKEMRKKQARSGGSRGGFIVSFGGGNSGEPLDLSELPRFESPKPSYTKTASLVMIDFGLLTLYTIAALAGAFIAFLRYDVR